MFLQEGGYTIILQQRQPLAEISEGKNRSEVTPKENGQVMLFSFGYRSCLVFIPGKAFYASKSLQVCSTRSEPLFLDPMPEPSPSQAS